MWYSFQCQRVTVFCVHQMYLHIVAHLTQFFVLKTNFHFKFSKMRMEMAMRWRSEKLKMNLRVGRLGGGWNMGSMTHRVEISLPFTLEKIKLALLVQWKLTNFLLFFFLRSEGREKFLRPYPQPIKQSPPVNLRRMKIEIAKNVIVAKIIMRRKRFLNALGRSFRSF